MTEREKRDPRTHAIIGAAIEVHRQLGCGLLEAVYQEAMALELKERRVPYLREVELPVCYKGQELSTSYRADLICFDSVIVELKALPRLSGIEQAQLPEGLRI
jgi:GxxExxY protein